MNVEKKMINKYVFVGGVVASIFAINVSAGDLTIANTYVEGETLTASSLNENMTAVKTAVDDNNARINDNKTQVDANKAQVTDNKTQIDANKAQHTANKTQLDMFDGDIASNISRLNGHDSAISTLQDRVSDLENPGAYVISIGHSAFKDAGSPSSSATHGDCLFTGAFANYIYPEPVATATNDACFASAGIQLPHGTTLTRLECTFFDNSSANNMNVHLNRTHLGTGVNTSVLRTAPTVDSTSVQTQNDTTLNTAGSDVIDNSTYAYNLFLNFSTNNFSSLGINARLYGCRITVNQRQSLTETHVMLCERIVSLTKCQKTSRLSGGFLSSSIFITIHREKNTECLKLFDVEKTSSL